MTEKDYVPLIPADLIRPAANKSAPGLTSAQFGDVYFSDLGGYEEAQHVYLNGNQLPQRFAALDQAHFSIGELGFGTGLNIMAVMQAWQTTAAPGNHLHIWSVEGFPLSPVDFAASVQNIAKQWPDLAPHAARLAAIYPPLTKGMHLLALTPTITLTLVFGDVSPAITQATGPIDAWFLDGFSPAQNPDMWRETVMAGIAKISAPGATVATFTIARQVRDGLEKAGFTLAKRPGFGRKRDMLTGNLAAPLAKRPDRKHGPGKTTIIKGGGIAGASLAWHLARLGVPAIIDDPAGLAAEASGNPAGLIMPRLDLDVTPAARFYRAAYLYTLHLLAQIDAENLGWFRACGVLQLSTDAASAARAERLAKAKFFPQTHLSLVTTQEASRLAGLEIAIDPPYPHLWFAQGGMIDPVRYTTHLAQAAAGQTTLKSPPRSLVTLHANSLQGVDLISPAGSLAPNLGQVDYLPSAPAPTCAMILGGYLGPAPAGGLVFGATFDREAKATPRPAPSQARSTVNLAQLIQILPSMADLDLAASQPRAAFRCVTPDQHPVAGQLDNGDYILSGLGSRGLVTAPLLAAMIAAQIAGTPAPVEADIQAMLRPNRFAERAARKLG